MLRFTMGRKGSMREDIAGTYHKRFNFLAKMQLDRMAVNRSRLEREFVVGYHPA